MLLTATRASDIFAVSAPSPTDNPLAKNGMFPAGTSLASGIGIHSWISNWPEGAHHLTWGCLSLRKADLLQVHGLVKTGTRVLILP
jgi:hypothetical protein